MTLRDRLYATSDPVAGSTILTARLPLKRQCAWCQVVLCEGREPVSHGCCRDCLAALTERAGSEAGQPIETGHGDPVASRSVSVAGLALSRRPSS